MFQKSTILPDFAIEITDVCLPSFWKKMAVLNDNARSRKRKYDPEDEIAFLRRKLDEERARRRSLEGDIYKLKLERSDLCIKMVSWELSST